LFPADMTNQITGGPMMSMLAALNPELYGQIGGGFDYSSPAVQENLAARQQYANMIDSQMYQDFTSGGG